jgi:hypothetical protein
VIATLPRPKLPAIRNEGFRMSECAAYDVTPKVLPVNEEEAEYYVI